MPVTSASPAVNARTRGSSDSALLSMGKGSGSSDATSALSVHDASARPAMPPPIDSSRLSVSSCRISRDRFAPSASLIATSRRRFVARDSIRLAMFAHAISRTMPTTIIRTVESCTRTLAPWPLGLSRACSSGTAVALRPLFSTGKACSRLAKMVRRLERACSTVTPGFSRATEKMKSPRRVSNHSGSTTTLRDIGSHDRRSAAEQHAGEALRRHADDGVRRAVQRDRPADGGRIRSEAALPEAVADRPRPVSPGFPPRRGIRGRATARRRAAKRSSPSRAARGSAPIPPRARSSPG